MELWIVVMIVVGLGFLMLLKISEAKRKADRIWCVSYLKNITLGSRVYANDHEELVPQQVTTNKGGSLEFVGTHQSWRHFTAMSYYLGDPSLLTCFADSLSATSNWGQFGSSNLSYFISLDAGEANSQAILAGDRDIRTGPPASHGILLLVANRPVGWLGEIHSGSGNIGLADGSVQQANSAALQAQVDANRVATNRIELP